MPHSFLLNIEKTPNAVLELLYRLKIRDAMTRKIITVQKDNTFRKVQMIMKQKHISGVPVVEEDRLIGLISVDDILNALDQGYIEETIQPYMTKNIVVLEDDMPLSFAISYFNKYPYRRFPVISKEKKLVGMLTSRDILSSLVRELDREIKELENKIKPEMAGTGEDFFRDFVINKFDFENAGKASFELKKVLKEKSASQKVIRRASVASYELEINLAIHTFGGKISFSISNKRLVIIALDDGPGIPDVDLAVQEGYSTANDWIRSLGFGAGMGLPNVKKFSDEFDIQSETGKGTMVKSVIYLDSPVD